MSLPDRFKLVFSLIILPLLFVLVAGCLWLAAGSVEQHARYRDSLATRLEQHQQVLAANPRAMGFDLDGKRRSVEQIVTQVRKRLDSADEVQLVEAQWLLGACALFAVMALLIGGGSLLWIRWLGQRAITDHAGLYDAFERVQRLMPWLLTSIMTSLVLAFTGLLAFPALYGGLNALAVTLGAVAIVFILLFAWRIRRASGAMLRYLPVELIGRNLPRHRAPELWQFVERIAGKVNAPMPDRIVAVLEEGFFVTESALQLFKGELIEGGRTLCLSLNYLNYLREDEAVAVIGHELAHFSGGDTEHGGRFVRAYDRVAANLDAVEEGNEQLSRWLWPFWSWWGWLLSPVQYLGHFFLDSFHAARQRWSRERELRADACGAAASSADAMARALVRIVVLAPVIHSVTARFWRTGGKMPKPFVATVAELLEQQAPPEPELLLEMEQVHPFDSHPPLGQRLQALQVVPDRTFWRACALHGPGMLLSRFNLA